MDLSAAKSHDLVLIERILIGHQEAMTALYDRYSALVYSFALKPTGRAGAAEEILQEVFLELRRTPGTCKPIPRGGLGPWLKDRVKRISTSKAA